MDLSKGGIMRGHTNSNKTRQCGHEPLYVLPPYKDSLRQPTWRESLHRPERPAGPSRILLPRPRVPQFYCR